jgi:hypothetical protein
MLDVDTWATRDISTRYTSRLAVACNIYGVPLTRMAAFWMYLCNPIETRRLPLGFYEVTARLEVCATRGGDRRARQLQRAMR